MFFRDPAGTWRGPSGGESYCAREAWAFLPGGDTNEHVQEAIRHLTAALEITSTEIYPDTWANAHNALAVALGNLPFRRKDDFYQGLRHANEALLRWKREDNPHLWAYGQSTLGMLYQKLGECGDKEAADLSIQHYRAALEEWTRESAAQQWAGAKTGLCISYLLRSVGKRSPRDARDAYNEGLAALDVWRPHAFPERYASTQNAIANVLVWMSSAVGKQAVQAAIGFYQAASKACSREGYPNLWARIQSNLGAAYRKLGSLDLARWTEAAQCIEVSSSILNEQAFPYDGALNKSRLADLTLLRPAVARERNLEEAQSYYDEALRLWPVKDYPEEWAAVQKSIADAYRPSDDAAPQDEIRRSISYYQAALTVKTREGFPVDYAELCVLLTGPLVFLAMQLVETPELERDSIGRALKYYREALETISVQHWFGGVVKSADVMGKLFCRMFASEMLAEFDDEFRGLQPLLLLRPFTEEEAKNIEGGLTRVLAIVDIWINRLKEEGQKR